MKLRIALYFIICFCILIIFNISSSKTLFFRNIKNNEVQIETSDSIPIILVFARTPCCHGCFLKLDKYFLNLKQLKFRFNVYLVLFFEDDIVSRKTNINYFKELIKVDSLFFDSNYDKLQIDFKGQTSYFKNLKIIKTPSLLVINKDKEIYFPLDSIFKESSNLQLFEKIEEALE